ncbi:hypothetical protein FHT09_002352 [Xanthomonas arboricola]|nr:hypothetical protein [Xanthomonas sp. CFBP 8152]
MSCIVDARRHADVGVAANRVAPPCRQAATG